VRRVLLLVTSFFTGHYRNKQDVTILSTEELKIQTRRKFYIDVEGDIKTTTPAAFRAIPKALKLFITELQE
jgi:diacylglycerol kinase family enzyme